MFGLNRGQPATRRRHYLDRGEEIERYYAKAIASDDVEHGRDHYGYTPSQLERRRLYVRATNQGLDANRVAYVKWLHSNARISDAAITDPAGEIRSRAGVGVPVGVADHD